MKKGLLASLAIIALLGTTVDSALAQSTTTRSAGWLERQIADVRKEMATLQTKLDELLKIQEAQKPVPPRPCVDFTRNLKTGDKGEDVRRLKEALLAEGLINEDTANATTTADVFTPADAAAVSKFQEKYANDILKIFGLGRGTGVVGASTRAKLNAMYRCGTAFITPAALGNAKVGENYNRQLTVHGLAAANWNLSDGKLPNGLRLEPIAVGTCPAGAQCSTMLAAPNRVDLVGTPTEAGTYSFTVQATNGTATATRAYVLNVMGTTTATSTPSAKAPVIKGVSGPTVLKTGDMGTWTIQASNSGNGNLAYSVTWGDEPVATGPASGTTGSASLEARQVSKLTHTYSQSGTYSPVFTVTNEAGLSAQASLSVTVNSTGQQTVTVKSPNGGEKWKANEVKSITWDYNGNLNRPKFDLYLHELRSCSAEIPCVTVPATPILLDRNISGEKYYWIVATDINDQDISAGDYRLRVCEAGSTSSCDSSDDTFTIAQ